MTELTMTTSSKGLPPFADVPQPTDDLHTCLLCDEYGGIFDASGVMTLRVEHFTPKWKVCSSDPQEPLISFAIDHGTVTVQAHACRITTDDAEILPDEKRSIDLEGSATLSKPKQVTIHCGKVLRHILIKPQHAVHQGMRAVTMWKLTLRQEKIELFA